MHQAKAEKRRITILEWVALGLLGAIVVGPAIVLGWESMRPEPDSPHPSFLAVAHWFDPVFFQYNLVMLVVGVLVIPVVALLYVWSMTRQKEWRLSRDLPEERQPEIRRQLHTRMRFAGYLGSVSLTTIVVLLGASIILLFKPSPSPDISGVDFSRGANVLMMGPFIELFDSDPGAYYIHLMRSLTAFQFGFLGAYIYFIGTLSRAYFTLDLTPQTFVDGTIRMITASMLALVISFLPGIHGSVHAAKAPESTVASVAALLTDLPTEPAADRTSEPDPSTAADAKPVATVGWSLGVLPVVSFMFGFFPKWALLGLQSATLRLLRYLGAKPAQSRELPLSMLGGMSYLHVARLEREGFDNVENFSTADPVGLAVCTGFTYPQLKRWISAAWLAAHLREDYPAFVRHTGITTKDELEDVLESWGGSVTDAADQLAKNTAMSQAMKLKLTVLGTLVCNEPERESQGSC